MPIRSLGGGRHDSRFVYIAKSAHSDMKQKSDTTWQDGPAIMMLTPFCACFGGSAVSAGAPPTACKIRAKILRSDEDGGISARRKACEMLAVNGVV